MKDNWEYEKSSVTDSEQQEAVKKEEEARKLRRYGTIGTAVAALLIIVGIIWQANGKTIAEMGKELEAEKKTENSAKADEEKKASNTTGQAVGVVTRENFDMPLAVVSEAAVQASAKREQLLAEQAAAEEARKKAEAEEIAKEEEQAAAKAGNVAETEVAKAEAPVVGTTKQTQSSGGMTSSYTPPAQSVDLNAYIDEVIRLVNVERASAGLSPVSKNSEACQGAGIRAKEIISSFSHTRPDGRDCFTVLEDLGITYTGCGENIAAGYATPEAVVQGWMNSPGHRANILNERFEEIGVGVAEAKGSLYWTQLFLRVNW